MLNIKLCFIFVIQDLIQNIAKFQYVMTRVGGYIAKKNYNLKQMSGFWVSGYSNNLKIYLHNLLEYETATNPLSKIFKLFRELLFQVQSLYSSISFQNRLSCYQLTCLLKISDGVLKNINKRSEKKPEIFKSDQISL